MMRVPVHSGTGKVTLFDLQALIELQTALELVPGSDISCLAFMANNRKCDEILGDPKGVRHDVLIKIASEMTRNGPSIASDRPLGELLDDLAATLICKKKHRLLKNGAQCVQVVHVAEILRARLDHFEEARNTSRKMEAHIRSRIPAGRQGKGRAISSDESGGRSSENEGYSGNNSNDGELSERDDEPTTALAHRPRAIPHQQSAAKSGQRNFKSLEKTPNRIQQRATGSGRHRHQSDESDASTPGTPVSRVFSTGRSKSSAVTVPTTGPSSSSSRFFLHNQRDETPTKQRRARDATDVESRSHADYGDEEGDSDGSASSSSSTSHSQAAKHEDSEPEAVSTEDDEPPTPTIAFEASKSGPSTANDILKTMLSTIQKGAHGYVYCFSIPEAEGFLKIGYAGIKEVQKMARETELPIPHSQYNKQARLWERLVEQRKRCKLDIQFEFAVYMPSAAHKMEKLIHATLRAHKKTVTKCINPKCKTQHEEWFKVTPRDARYTVDEWKKFSKLMPFKTNGHLIEQWYDYARDHLRHATFAEMSGEVWFDKEWKRTVAQAGKERRQQKRNEARMEKIRLEKIRLEKIRMEQLEKEVEQAEQGVEQAEEDLDEKRRLVEKAELHTAKVKLRNAREEMSWAEKKLGEKKRQLEEKKKRRTTLG